MKKVILLLFIIGNLIFANKKEMINFMQNHNRNLKENEASYIYDITMYYSKKYGVDPALVFSVMKTESHFRHSTISSKGALGLMQLMPFNIKEFGVDNSIEGNIKGGIMHLHRDFDKTKDIVKTLVCYNAGCSRLENNAWLRIRETTDYVTKINKIYPQIKNILLNGKRYIENENFSSLSKNEEILKSEKVRKRNLKIKRDNPEKIKN